MSSSVTCLPASKENLDPPAKGGFFALWKRTGQGSLCPSAPSLPNRWGRLTYPAGSLGGLSRAGKEGTAEHERARNERESSNRAAGFRTTKTLEIFAKTQRRIRQKPRGKSGYLDPLQPLSRTLSPVFLGVFLPVSQGVLSANRPRPRDSKPKPPDQNDTSPALRPSAWERCRFYGFFGI